MTQDLETILAAHEGGDHSWALLEEQDWTLDWANQPSPYKRDPGAERIDLPRTFPAPMLNPFEAAGGARRFAPPGPIDLPTLAQWLWCAYGITATKTYGEGKILYRRTAPSGGALYPAEVYLFANAINGLPPGFYHFDVSAFALERLGDASVFRTVSEQAVHPALADAPFALAVSAIWWRNAWKYRWRNFRYCNQDLGHVVGNMLIASECMALDATAIFSFNDEGVNRALGFESFTEGVLALVAVQTRGGEANGFNTARAHTVPRIITLDELPDRGEITETRYDNVEMAKRATLYTEVDSIAGGRGVHEPKPVEGLSFVGEPVPARHSFTDVACTDLVRACIDRRTSRDYTDKPLAVEDLGRILDYAYRVYPADLYAPDAIRSRLQEIFLNIHAVQGIEPGAYYYDQEGRALRRLKVGDFREQSKTLTLDQECAGRSAVCLFQFGNLKNICEAYGPRGYRYLLQEGGIAGARIYLAARALGIGAGGIGAFADRECGPFFGIADPYLRPLYTLTLGYEIEDTRIVDTA